jgi:hypothetical protein
LNEELDEAVADGGSDDDDDDETVAENCGASPKLNGPDEVVAVEDDPNGFEPENVIDDDAIEGTLLADTSVVVGVGMVAMMVADAGNGGHIYSIMNN